MTFIPRTLEHGRRVVTNFLSRCTRYMPTWNFYTYIQVRWYLESVIPQHNLVAADFHFWVHLQRSKRVQASRTKWWKLKEETTKIFKERVLKEDPWHEGRDANSMWIKMSTCIRKVASEEFGVAKESKRETKETWWWNEKVQNAI
jgi:hypothetical protein